MKTMLYILTLSIVLSTGVSGEENLRPQLPMAVDTVQESELHVKTWYKTPLLNEEFRHVFIKQIIDIGSDGVSVRLEDGSCLQPAYYFGRKEVKNVWAVGDEVVVSYEFYSGYPSLVLHNITKGLSVYGLMIYPPKKAHPGYAEITAIHHNSIETSFGTTATFSSAPYDWAEFCVGDQIILLLPLKGTCDGSTVHVWNNRLGILGLHWSHSVTQ